MYRAAALMACHAVVMLVVIRIGLLNERDRSRVVHP